MIDPTVALQDYLRMTALAPRSDLVERVTRRVAQEPRSTAPRRLLSALSALDGQGALRGLRATLATAFGSARAPLLLRLQAGTLAIVMIAGIGLGSVGAVAGVGVLLAELTARPQVERVVPPPSPEPAVPETTASPSPEVSSEPRAKSRDGGSIAPSDRPAVRDKSAERAAPAPRKAVERDRDDEQRDRGGSVPKRDVVDKDRDDEYDWDDDDDDDDDWEDEDDWDDDDHWDDDDDE